MNYVYGTTENDIMFATASSDWIYGLAGGDAMHGDLGKDIFSVDATDYKEYIQDFEQGSDLIDLTQVGITDFDQLNILFEYDTRILETDLTPMRLYVNLMDPADGVPTMTENDFIYAGTPLHTYSTGSDLVTVTSNEYSVHFGNGGTDRLDLRTLLTGVEARTEGALVEMDRDRLGNGKFEVQNVTQHFFEFRDVRGTRGGDEIYGDYQGNRLMGMDGTDLIHGRGGSDKIWGHGGNDTLWGQYGDDTINGGGGDDVLSGGYGHDELTGGTSDDIFVFCADDTGQPDLVADFQDGFDRFDVSHWGVTSFDQLNVTDLGNGRLSVSSSEGSFHVDGYGGVALSVDQIDSSDFIFA